MSLLRLFTPKLQFSASLLVFLLLQPAIASAVPATAFMLQFGSFESAKEANARIAALKAKHGGLIGNFPSRVVEVALPDNLTVYRTQSGPVPSRADAQSICAQLASNGDECYVVETAMIQSTPAQTFANNLAEQKVTAPQNTIENTVEKTAVNIASESASTTTASINKAASQAATASNALKQEIVTPRITNEAVPLAKAAETTVSIPSAETKIADKALVDTAGLSGNMPAVKALSSAPTLNNIAKKDNASSTIDDDAAVLDKKLAAIETPASSRALTEKPPASPSSSKSFWSRLNPFSSSDDSKPKTEAASTITNIPAEASTKTAVKIPDQVVSVVDTAEQASVAQVSKDRAAVIDSSIAHIPNTASIEKPAARALNSTNNTVYLPPPSPLASKIPAIETVADDASIKSSLASDAKNVIVLPHIAVGTSKATAASSLQLPPPPPLTEASKPIFDKNNRELPLITGTKITENLVRTPSAQTEPSVPAPPFSTASNETLARLGKVPLAGKGTVTVEEAKRVPLSQQNNNVPLEPHDKAFIKPSGSSVAPPDASIPLTEHTLPVVSGNLASPQVSAAPSDDTPKTVWAELGRFSDAPHALAFWDKFRSTHQDFPVVRVRLTQTYAQKSRGESAVNLRVGPFSKNASINYLCNNIEAQDIYCRPVVDSGVSSAAADSRIRLAQGEATLANSSTAHASTPGAFWVQLGSYPSLAQAQNTWAELKRRYADALSAAEPNISVPVLASSSRPQYRLRSGPYASNIAATQACLRLKSAGGNCLVSTQ